MIGEDFVFIVVYCLYGKKDGGWVKKVIVYFGYNGMKVFFGIVKVRKMYVLKEWIKKEFFIEDYGVIKLDKNIGIKIGIMGLIINIFGVIIISGYYGDKKGKLYI